MNSEAFNDFSLLVGGDHSEIRWKIEDFLWPAPPKKGEVGQYGGLAWFARDWTVRDMRKWIDC